MANRLVQNNKFEGFYVQNDEQMDAILKISSLESRINEIAGFVMESALFLRDCEGVYSKAIDLIPAATREVLNESFMKLLPFDDKKVSSFVNQMQGLQDNFNEFIDHNSFDSAEQLIFEGENLANRVNEFLNKMNEESEHLEDLLSSFGIEIDENGNASGPRINPNAEEMSF